MLLRPLAAIALAAAALSGCASNDDAAARESAVQACQSQNPRDSYELEQCVENMMDGIADARAYDANAGKQRPPPP